MKDLELFLRSNRVHKVSRDGERYDALGEGGDGTTEVEARLLHGPTCHAVAPSQCEDDP